MDSRNLPIENLSFDDCWELLANDMVGRLAIVVDEHPEIFPVNYAVHLRSIVFRTAPGSKLWGARMERPAAGRFFAGCRKPARTASLSTPAETFM